MRIKDETSNVKKSSFWFVKRIKKKKHIKIVNKKVCLQYCNL